MKWSSQTLRKLIRTLPRLISRLGDPISDAPLSAYAPTSPTLPPTEPVPRADRTRPITFTESQSFGTNPGNLRYFQMCPPNLSPRAPLVVLLHGCGQSAQTFSNGTGWAQLALQQGFVLLAPEQRFRNNPTKCFNWFNQADSIRDSGEALSIRQMIEHISAHRDIDHNRIFIVGLSAGGAMTTAMLAAYPKIFAAGAVIAGLPFGAAIHMGQALSAMRSTADKGIEGWQQKIRDVSEHDGPWPRLSIWHGRNDMTVAPANALALEQQWRGLHGLSDDNLTENTSSRATIRSWRNGSGIILLERIMIAAMDHGAPIDQTGKNGPASGTAGQYHLDVGISSTHHIAKFWGLIH